MYCRKCTKRHTIVSPLKEPYPKKHSSLSIVPSSPIVRTPPSHSSSTVDTLPIVSTSHNQPTQPHFHYTLNSSSPNKSVMSDTSFDLLCGPMMTAIEGRMCTSGVKSEDAFICQNDEHHKETNQGYGGQQSLLVNVSPKKAFKESHNCILQSTPRKGSNQSDTFIEFNMSLDMFAMSQVISYDHIESDSHRNVKEDSLHDLEGTWEKEIENELQIAEDDVEGVICGDGGGEEETFFGLPVKVKELLVENRRIKNLYGEVAVCVCVCVCVFVCVCEHNCILSLQYTHYMYIYKVDNRQTYVKYIHVIF